MPFALCTVSHLQPSNQSRSRISDHKPQFLFWPGFLSTDLLIRDTFRPFIKRVLGHLRLLGIALLLLKSVEARLRPQRKLVKTKWLENPIPKSSDDPTMIDAAISDLANRELTTSVPPEDLIFVVNGHRDQINFAASRSATIVNIASLLSGAGVDFRQFQSLLDFGCGCGRVLSDWEHFVNDGKELFGFDINPSLVRFCQDNIPFAKTAVSSYFPPLPLGDASIDFAYAASVWTHLSLPAAIQWAGEFSRVIAHGGIALVSYHGSYFAPTLAQISKEGSRELEEKRFHVHLHGSAEDTFKGSNNYATFMTSAFMRQLFTGFDVLRIYPGVSCGPNPFASYQDIVVLIRT
jgi:SAM-dependent methyltransferase